MYINHDRFDSRAEQPAHRPEDARRPDNVHCRWTKVDDQSLISCISSRWTGLSDFRIVGPHNLELFRDEIKFQPVLQFYNILSLILYWNMEVNLLCFSSTGYATLAFNDIKIEEPTETEQT